MSSKEGTAKVDEILGKKTDMQTILRTRDGKEEDCLFTQ